VKVGDLVQDIVTAAYPEEPQRLGVVLKITERGAFHSGLAAEVWINGRIEEWDKDELVMINESR